RLRTSIPGDAVKAPVLEYYIEGVDAQGTAIASRGDSQSPLRIAVTEPSRGWVLPVAIGGGILGAAAIVGGLALAGVFKGSSSSGGGGGGAGPGTGPGTGPGNKPPGNTGPGNGTVSVTVGESAIRWR